MEGIIVVFVSTDGDDNNDGLSPLSPVRSMYKAMDIASGILPFGINLEIRVGAGVYTPGSGLSVARVGFLVSRPNLIISGGWNSDFSNVVGRSEFNGNNALYHVIRIENVENLTLRNLVIRGGNANSSDPNDKGGGIYVRNVSYLVIEDSVIVSENFATSGGGIFLANSSNVMLSCSVFNNKAQYGGGVSLDNSSNNTIGGSVYNNNASLYGGGLYLYHSSNNILNGDVYGNSAIYGGGISFDNSSDNTIGGSIHSNNAQYGGGLYLMYSPNNTVIGQLYGNNASYDGGGVLLWTSDHFVNKGSITNNKAVSNGGGVYMNLAHPNSSFGNVSNNLPNNFNIT